MSYGEGAKLIASRPGAPGQEFPLGGQPVVIGRDPTCEIVVDSPVVSRQHARIAPQGDEYVVEDAGATNGLFVNGRRVEGPQILVPGDKIQVGEENFVFMPAIVDAMQTQIVRSSTAPLSSSGRLQPPQSGVPPWPMPSGASATPPPPPPASEMSGAIPESMPERPADETTILPRPAPTGGSGGFQAPPPPSYQSPTYSAPSPPSFQPPGFGWEAAAQPATTAQLAGWWRRAGEYLIDGLILSAAFFVAYIILIIVGLGLLGAFSSDNNSSASGAGVLGVFLGIYAVFGLISLAYFTWGWGTGHSLGCRAVGVAIVDARTGGPPGYGKGFVRILALLLIGLVGSILIGIPSLLNFLWPLWDGKKQTWHDKLAGTLVVYEDDRRVNEVRFNVPPR